MRSCDECGNAIEGRRASWCSFGCRRTAWMRRRRVANAAARAASSCRVCRGPIPAAPARSHVRTLCSNRCAQTAFRSRHRVEHPLDPCAHCGQAMTQRRQTGGPRQRWCSLVCKRRHHAQRRTSLKRASGWSGRYTMAEVAARTAWRCHLCDVAVDPTLSGLHPDGPTVDHVLPLSRGGPDTLPNVRLAHRRCNVKRGAKVLVAA